MKPYVVKQGDYLAKLAFRFGFDADQVWGDAKNRELSDERDPNLLMPGDILYIPDKPKPSGLTVNAKDANAFNAQIPTVPVSLHLKSPDGKALVGEPYELHGLDEIIYDTTKGRGLLKVDVPVTTAAFVVVLPQQKTSFEVRVGHLCPLEEKLGAAGQLASLGYLELPEGLSLDIIKDELAEAIALFQKDKGLALTRKFDDDTVAALAKAYDP